MAEPIAAKRWEWSGAIICDGPRFNVLMKDSRSSERKWSGPPKKATFPLIGFPQARPDMVWLTTAWKIDAARSSFVAPSLISGCMSDFAKTPHLAAIGYIDW